jgi:hypothetical protein
MSSGSSSSMCVSVEQLVELGLNRLSVAVLGPLDEQRHEPRGHCRHRMPVECLALEKEPRSAVRCDDEERQWMRRVYTNLSQASADALEH